MTNYISESGLPSQIKTLLEKGVKMPLPRTVYFSEEVNPANISGKGVIIYPGCRITGKDTFIHHGSQIGKEAPVTIENCQIGCQVKLKGGYFSNAVFLDDVSMGYGSHVREGTICEEGASVAHTVGLKQTILLPFVTLGSLINFCDCLMAGGTSRKNHSEVGSSYIHFNYTPNQDKATASLIGDVPRGVLLKERPIFLGGQGGLVGPCRLSYGTVVAAGTILRKDEERPDRLIVGGAMKNANLATGGKINQNVMRIVRNNINYIANLIALKTFYVNVRTLFISDRFPSNISSGLIEKVDKGITERIKRLSGFRDNIDDRNHTFYKNWPSIEKDLICFQKQIPDENGHMVFQNIIRKKIADSGDPYIVVIRQLTEEETEIGAAWLQSVVDTINSGALKQI